MEARRTPKLAVWKFASCDGCQLSLLDCEDELLAVAAAVDVANFPEASRAVVKGPYDLSLVEGSITTPHDAERIREVRRASKFLVTIGACATAGGIQALRNFAAAPESRPSSPAGRDSLPLGSSPEKASRDDAAGRRPSGVAPFTEARDFISAVYATPEYVTTLETSTPISQHVRVDFELRGCPIAKHQLIEVLSAFLHPRRPNIPTHSLCVDCKRRGLTCVMVSQGTPCLGPVTQTGCGALCPAYNRGCYGCFGPMESPNTESLGLLWERLGMTDIDVMRAFRSFNAFAPAFRSASESYERKQGS